MRWLVASTCAVLVLLLTFPVLASGSEDETGTCTSAVGLRTLGSAESCDTWGVAVSLPGAVLVFVLIAWGWKRARTDRDD